MIGAVGSRRKDLPPTCPSCACFRFCFFLPPVRIVAFFRSFASFARQLLIYCFPAQRSKSGGAMMMMMMMRWVLLPFCTDCCCWEEAAGDDVLKTSVTKRGFG